MNYSKETTKPVLLSCGTKCYLLIFKNWLTWQKIRQRNQTKCCSGGAGGFQMGGGGFWTFKNWNKMSRKVYMCIFEVKHKIWNMVLRPHILVWNVVFFLWLCLEQKAITKYLVCKKCTSVFSKVGDPFKSDWCYN